MDTKHSKNNVARSIVEEIPLPVIGYQAQDSQPAVTSQPVSTHSPTNGWMDKPAALPNCPAGLEYLTALDELHIYIQKEMDYQYKVTNKNNEIIYKVQIETEAKFCISKKQFLIKIFDNYDKMVMKISHPFGCESCFCCLLSQKIEIFAPPDMLIGSLEQEWNLLYPTYAVKNENQDIILRIEGPCGQLECCFNTDFKIITPDGENEIGRTWRTWEISSNQDTDQKRFGISFANNLDVNTKAVLLCSSFFFNLVYLNVG